MSETLVLNHEIVGDSILSNYKLNNSMLSDIFPKKDFISITDDDAKLLAMTFISKQDTESLWKLLKRDQIYDILSSNDIKQAVNYVLRVDTVKDALIASVKDAENFNPLSVVIAPLPQDSITNLTKWKNTNTGRLAPIITSDEYNIIYDFDYKNEKSLFLAIVFAVPELLNQLVLHFKHVDSVTDEKFMETEVLLHFKQEFQEVMNNSASTEEDLLNSIATVVFISVGKIIETMADLFQKLDVKVSDTRAAVINFIFHFAGVGVQVNDEIWGDSDNVLNCLKMIFDTKTNELKVINSVIYMTKYASDNPYPNSLPSSFYYKYDIHGKEFSNTTLYQYKTSEKFWTRIIFDGYNAMKSSKNFSKYIKSRLK